MRLAYAGRRDDKGSVRLAAVARASLVAFAALFLSACAHDAPTRQGGLGPTQDAEPRSSQARTNAESGSDTQAPDSSGLQRPSVRRLERPDWVEARAEVWATDEEAPASARARAIAEARQAAVEFVAGVAVRSSVVTFDHAGRNGESDLLQALTRSRSDALVIDEKVVASDVLRAAGQGYRVRIVLQARVLEHRHGARAAFETEVRMDRRRYREGDAVELSVRSSEDARIYVLVVGEGGAAVLLPNRHLPDTRIEAQTWLRFPGAELAERGVVLQAALPEGRQSADEALIVVALRGERRLQSLVPASGATFRSAESSETMALLSDFLSPLLTMPASDWTFDQVVYRIEAD